MPVRPAFARNFQLFLPIDKSTIAILDTMENRRAYATLDKNIQCIWTVNGSIVGPALNSPDV